MLARSFFAVAGLVSLAGLVFLVSSSFAATPLRIFKAHTWQLILVDGLPAAHAFACRECKADLIVRCVAPGRGVIELTVVAAAVSNGRQGATKQIRFILGTDRLQRRAVTERQANGYVPVLELGFDDDLLGHLTANEMLGISFYGQRSYVGLRGASEPIGKVLDACRPIGSTVGQRHCVWASIISCSSDRAKAETLRERISGSFVRSVREGYCVAVASEELATARAKAARYGGYVERSCLN